MKKTVVVGAIDKPEKYGYKATVALQKRNHEVVPVGLKDGVINGIKIINGLVDIADVDTVTLYVGPKNQPYWYDYIIGLHPKRVIFNPGTENPEFQEILLKNKIEVLEACTLIMLSIGNY
ncbi:MAG: CoA-binding protein [Bacteroidota bacterium]